MKFLSQVSTKYGFIAVITLLWGITVFDAFDNGEFLWSKAVHSTGELAWKMLMFTIFISLFYKIFFRIHVLPQVTNILRSVLPYRKYTGIFAFLIAFSHGIFAYLQRNDGLNLENIWQYTVGDISITFGLIAFLAMLPAFITSTTWAVKVMGPKAWKNFQRLAHVAFVFTVLHIAFIPYAKYGSIEAGAFVPLVLYVGGYAYLFFTEKKT